MHIYYRLQEATEPGEMDHHESDLYVRSTPAVREILAQHDGPATPFYDSEGVVWWDLPFQYLPFWQWKRGRA